VNKNGETSGNIRFGSNSAGSKAMQAKSFANVSYNSKHANTGKIIRMVSNGELNAKMIYVESEHSAISALFGVYATGMRVLPQPHHKA